MILSADIGGTKTSIALSDQESPIQYIRQTTYQNSDFSSFDEIVKDFSSKEEINIMVLGIAGPISGRMVSLTNLDWSINADYLETEFESKVFLLNDLEAAAYATPYIDNKHLQTVYSGKKNHQMHQNVEVIVSVGTGLGVAKIYDGSKKIIFSSEGGHIGFSPLSSFQEQFFKYVGSRKEHVSFEMMVSSIGYRNLRSYILKDNHLDFSEEFIKILEKTPDIPRLLLKTANLSNPDSKICETLIKEMSIMLGSFLGNMVLVHLPKTIYLTGGIGRNLTEENSLLKGYLQKANMTHVVENSDVHIITDPNFALHGTSFFAAEYLSN